METVRLLDQLVLWIREFPEWSPALVGRTTRIESGVVRKEEDPPSAALHFTLDGKEYVATIQPTDMPPIG